VQLNLSRIVLCAVAACLLAAEPILAQPVRTAAIGKETVSAPQYLEDVPQPLQPKRARTPNEQDRLEAAALFAAGRTKLQQQDFAGALRLYQRALRFDPAALPILEQIVPLAFQLDRPEEAVRYALKAVELDPSGDPVLITRLAAFLSEQGDWQGALTLYEKAIALENQQQKKSPRHVVLMLEMGRLYSITKQIKQAASAFGEVIEAFENPKDFGLSPRLQRDLFKEPAKIYELFGDTFLEAGELDRAVAAYQKAQETTRDQAVLAYHLARVHAAKQEHDKALEQLQIYFDAKATSQRAEPYELLAEILEKQKKQEELIPRLEKVLANDSENGPLGHYMADLYLKAERLDQAEPIYARLHEKKPSHESYAGLAHIYRLKKQSEPLFKLLGQAAGEAGGFEPLGQESKALLEDKDLLASVLGVAAKQAKDDPEGLDFGGRLAAALLALNAKQFDTAGEFFNRAIEADRKKAAELLLTWGIGLLADEQYSEAAEVFQRGVDDQVLPSDNPAFHFYLAGALELAGRTDDSLKVARKAVDLAQDNPRMHSRVAWIQYHAKRYDDAYKSYVELIERFDGPKTDPPLRNSSETRSVLREARLVLSNLCVLRKDLPEAEEWLEQILDEFPEDTSALNDLGYIWADQGKNLQRALAMVQKAVADDPDNHAYLDSLGWALYRLGRYDEALMQLKKAAEGEETDGVILDHLGDCYLKLNQIDKALQTWRRAIEAWDPKDDAEEIKAAREKIEKHGGQ
jgi:tetratricopeptide (TPR) repeat protein